MHKPIIIKIIKHQDFITKVDHHHKAGWGILNGRGIFIFL